MAASTLTRSLLRIDEERCDGCGKCLPACVNSAIQMIDGKARVRADAECNSLGGCMGECPRKAISIEIPIDEDFGDGAIGGTNLRAPVLAPGEIDDYGPITPPVLSGAGASSSVPRMASQADPGVSRNGATAGVGAAVEGQGAGFDEFRSPGLPTWPVKLKLVQPFAPFLAGADLLVCADCAPLGVPDFHRRYLQGRVVLIGCPKMGNIEEHRAKLQAIAAQSKLKSVTVLRMEVSCCSALGQAAIRALRAVSPNVPLEIHTLGIQGTLGREVVRAASPARPK